MSNNLGNFTDFSTNSCIVWSSDRKIDRYFFGLLRILILVFLRYYNPVKIEKRKIAFTIPFDF